MRWLLVFVCVCTAIRAQRIQMSVVSPVPCIEKTRRPACCTYQALPDEKLHFAVASTADRPIDIDLILYENARQKAFESCRSRTCKVSWISSNVTTTVNSVVLYSVTASPYDGQIGSETKVICIEVYRSELLNFSVTPGANIMSENGKATVTYVAMGYPEPEKYLLYCTGLPTGESANGSFLLVGLPDGEVQCQAIAVSRLSQVRSPVTTIVTRRQRTIASVNSRSDALGGTAATEEKDEEKYGSRAATSEKISDSGPTLAVICALGIAGLVALVIVFLIRRKTPGPSTTIVNEQFYQHAVIVQSDSPPLDDSSAAFLQNYLEAPDSAEDASVVGALV